MPSSHTNEGSPNTLSRPSTFTCFYSSQENLGHTLPFLVCSFPFTHCVGPSANPTGSSRGSFRTWPLPSHHARDFLRAPYPSHAFSIGGLPICFCFVTDPRLVAGCEGMSVTEWGTVALSTLLQPAGAAHCPAVNGEAGSSPTYTHSQEQLVRSPQTPLHASHPMASRHRKKNKKIRK